MRLVQAGLRPDPLGELRQLPRTPSCIKGGGEGERKEVGGGNEVIGGPPMSEVR